MPRTAPDVGFRSIPTPMLLTLALLSGIAPLATDMYLPGLPRVGDDLAASTSTVQLTLTTFMLGLAVGQLLVGPLSDAAGRRRPLIVGTVLLTVAGLVCALAPSVIVLIVFRFLQGVTGGIGVVVARAVIADRASGDAAARLFSLMMIISSAAPVIAPLIGGVLVGPIGWRGVFYVLTGLAAVMLLAVWRFVPETLPVERRHPMRVGAVIGNVVEVARRRRYLGFVLTFAFAFGALFAYISASPFVMQDLMGFTPGQFSMLFATNAMGIVIASWINARLVGRVRPVRVLGVGVGALLGVGAAMTAVSVLAPEARLPMLVLMFGLSTSFGLIAGNATALAIAEVRDRAGAGSALLGTLQFTLGAIVPPLAGIGGPTSPLPMAAVIGVCGLCSAIAFTVARRSPVSG